MLVYMFYVLPFYGLAVYALIFPGCTWLPDWALVFAGAIGQVRWGLEGEVGRYVGKKVSTYPSTAFMMPLVGWCWAFERSHPQPAAPGFLLWGRKSQRQTLPTSQDQN